MISLRTTKVGSFGLKKNPFKNIGEKEELMRLKRYVDEGGMQIM